MRLVDTTSHSIYFIWSVVDKEVTDGLYSRQNTRGRHVYVVRRSSLDSLKLGCGSWGKPHDSVILLIAKTRKRGCDAEKNFFNPFVAKWRNSVATEGVVAVYCATGNSFTFFCFDSGRDSPEKFVWSTYVYSVTHSSKLVHSAVQVICIALRRNRHEWQLLKHWKHPPSVLCI